MDPLVGFQTNVTSNVAFDSVRGWRSDAKCKVNKKWLLRALVFVLLSSRSLRLFFLETTPGHTSRSVTFKQQLNNSDSSFNPDLPKIFPPSDPAFKWKHIRPGSEDDDKVLWVDPDAYDNVLSTYETAHAEYSYQDDDKDNLGMPRFTVLPLMATTVVRPPSTRTTNSHNQANSCTWVASTFVSDVQFLAVKSVQKHATSQCWMCFLDDESRQCFPGQAQHEGLFLKFQRENFPFLGYPWTVHCTVTGNTCEEVSHLALSTRVTIHTRWTFRVLLNDTTSTNNASSSSFEDVHATPTNSFSIDTTTPLPTTKNMQVDSQWDWAAVTPSLPRLSFRNDFPNPRIPANPQELKLAMVEGPRYDRKALGLPVLEEEGHARSTSVWLAKFYHLLRNSHQPLVYFIGTVMDEEQRSLQQSYQDIYQLLQLSMVDLYTPERLQSLQNRWMRNPTSRNNNNNTDNATFSSGMNTIVNTMTLKTALQYRQIQIRMIPLAVPVVAVDQTICGAQYGFAPYIAARLAGEFHVVAYLDDDAVLVELPVATTTNLQTITTTETNSTTATPVTTPSLEPSPPTSLQDVLWHHFYNTTSGDTICPGFRFPAIENYVVPNHYHYLSQSSNTSHDAPEDGVLQCIDHIWLDAKHQKKMLKECKGISSGHIVGRSDAVHNFGVHYAVPLPSEELPDGVSPNCTRFSEINRHRLLEIHLRNRPRKEICTCSEESER